MQNITPFLWFDKEAEEAMKFYVSIFPRSRVLAVTHYTEAGPGPKGSVMTANFELDGVEFTALNGGPLFKFTEAVSFVVKCRDQKEVDHYWEKLSGGGGSKGQCGWLKDKYGMSWQVVPNALMDLLKGKDAHKTKRVVTALMKMTKLDIKALQDAAKG